jgi:hypothetical protein
MIFKTHVDGEYRYKWKYIIIPKYFSNGCWVWLEKKYVRQVYFSSGLFDTIFTRGWYDVCLSNPKTGLPLEIK